MADTQKRPVRNRVSTKKPRKATRASDTEVGRFVRGIASDVRAQFAQTVDLSTFRATADSLTSSERLLLIEQALVLIESNYVHLPLKQAMHATDPVQALKLLRYRVETEGDALGDLEFHRVMTGIFMSMRDLHTNYLLPDPFRGMVAFVPFMVEEFTEAEARRYLVTNISEGFSEPHFAPGVEVTSWNGIPIARAVEIQGAHYAGSNAEARRARGAATLTVRQLALALPPDEDFVLVGYTDAAGQARELRVDWMVVSAPLATTDILPPDPRDSRGAASVGQDLEMQAVQHVQKLLYARHAAADEQRKGKLPPPEESAGAAEAGAAVSGSLGPFVPVSVMDGRTVETASGRFGHIRIRSFSYQHPALHWTQIVQSYVDRFIELAESLPQEGLIIDVRGNGGGIIMAGERLLQLMTPRDIQPEPTQFITSALNLDICEAQGFLAPWVTSLREATITGAQYSRGVPITAPAEANDTGQRYFGPVVLITDALCYSTTDIFAAGFQDHAIGPVIGVHNNTGAGGANVWTHDLLQQFLPGSVPGSPYRPLPKQAAMRVSVRRTMRVGENAGTPVEDLGVKPDHLRPLSRNDILNGNEDLLEFAGSILAGMPMRALQVSAPQVSGGTLTLTLTTEGLSGCDVFADGRAQGSVEIEDGETVLTVEVGSASEIELRCFDGDVVAARRRLQL